MSRLPFECDMAPADGVLAPRPLPRIRMDFENGWTGSVVFRVREDGVSAMFASVAACPTGKWGSGRTEVLESEAFPDEVVRLLESIRQRPEAKEAR